jgi:hypothetical protein
MDMALDLVQSWLDFREVVQTEFKLGPQGMGLSLLLS